MPRIVIWSNLAYPSWNQAYSGSDKKLISSKAGEEKKAIGQKIQRKQRLFLCMELINKQNPLSKEEQMQNIQMINSKFSGLAFSKELIKRLERSLSGSSDEFSLEKVQLCKGWEDLFLSGSEVSGSCQRVDASASLNKSLLAYCLDGKNAMLAVKGEDGKVLARSMLRLLWNREDSRPVLFLDRLYPDPCLKEREKVFRSRQIIARKGLG